MRIHAGLVFTLARTQENTIEEVFPEHFAKSTGDFTSVRIHAAPVFAPGRIEEKSW